MSQKVDAEKKLQQVSDSYKQLEVKQQDGVKSLMKSLNDTLDKRLKVLKEQLPKPLTANPAIKIEATQNTAPGVNSVETNRTVTSDSNFSTVMVKNGYLGPINEHRAEGRSRIEIL